MGEEGAQRVGTQDPVLTGHHQVLESMQRVILPTDSSSSPNPLPCPTPSLGAGSSLFVNHCNAITESGWGTSMSSDSSSLH